MHEGRILTATHSVTRMCDVHRERGSNSEGKYKPTLITIFQVMNYPPRSYDIV